MSIALFGAYCLVVRKSPKVTAWVAIERRALQEMERRFLEGMPDGPRLPPFEDENIFVTTAGGSALSTQAAVEELSKLGCEAGTDFAVWVSHEADECPPWLREVDGGVEYVHS